MTPPTPITRSDLVKLQQFTELICFSVLAPGSGYAQQPSTTVVIKNRKRTAGPWLSGIRFWQIYKEGAIT